jgi:hypothetical protein
MTATVFEAAPLDSYAERITTGIAMLGGVLMLPALFWYLSGIGPIGGIVSGVAVSAAIAITLAVWLLLNYAVMPVSYRVEPDQLVIRRRWARPLRIPYTQITGVSTAGGLADVPRRGLRRSFNAGVFGYQGPFQLAPYGSAVFAATHRERLVAIARIDQPPLIVSPNRPRSFVETLRETLLHKQEDRVTGDE